VGAGRLRGAPSAFVSTMQCGWETLVPAGCKPCASGHAMKAVGFRREKKPAAAKPKRTSPREEDHNLSLRGTRDRGHKTCRKFHARTDCHCVDDDHVARC
jgi:hypothetical protein